MSPNERGDWLGAMLNEVLEDAADRIRCGVAATGARAVRRVEKKIAGLAGSLEREAACSCSPRSSVVTGPDGAPKAVLMHRKGCAARDD